MAVVQKQKRGGKKLRRMARKSPSERRVEARGKGKPLKVSPDSRKGNYRVLLRTPRPVTHDGRPVTEAQAYQLKV